MHSEYHLYIARVRAEELHRAAALSRLIARDGAPLSRTCVRAVAKFCHDHQLHRRAASARR